MLNVPGSSNSGLRRPLYFPYFVMMSAISAASILAKVTRDHLCLELDQQFPNYGFAKHKGYGTAQHLDALAAHGICTQHRRSFAPVRQCLDMARPRT